jgi:SLOG cluster3 family
MAKRPQSKRRSLKVAVPKRVFLAASVPLPSRDAAYFDTADVIAIRDAIRALTIVILEKNAQLVFGGHPAISPMIRLQIAQAGISVRDKVVMYQSRFFDRDFPVDNAAFERVILIDKVDNERDKSLARMRDEMLSGEFSCGVFVGIQRTLAKDVSGRSISAPSTSHGSQNKLSAVDARQVFMDDFLGIVSAEEIETLRRARRDGTVHPVANLALSKRDASNFALVAVNTEAAARLIATKSPEWLKALRPRLLATDDFTHASSALGEIRAYGALLESWVSVNPAPKIVGRNVSPEFEIDNQDGSVIVEVHSRQLDNDEAASIDTAVRDLKTRHAEKLKNTTFKRSLISMGTTEVFPTGRPNHEKRGDSVLTNTISKIASIKSNEAQIDPSKPFILWLDLQDNGVWGLPLSLELFTPLFSQLRDGQISSGPFWFALYGRKGDPLLESRGFDYRSMPLAHEGRFFQTMKSHGNPTRVSAVVFSIPQATLLMENPNAERPLPPNVRAALLKLPRFSIGPIHNRMVTGPCFTLSRISSLTPRPQGGQQKNAGPNLDKDLEWRLFW